MKDKLKFFLAAVRPIAAGVALYLIVFNVFHPFIVSGESMYPTYKDQNVVISTSDFSEDTLAYGDVVICKVKRGMVIKRIVALPGDTLQVKDGMLYVNGSVSKYNYDNINEGGVFTEPIKLNAHQFVVMGDNRNHSQDSREYGPLNVKNIKYLVTKTIIG